MKYLIKNKENKKNLLILLFLIVVGMLMFILSGKVFWGMKEKSDKEKQDVKMEDIKI
jgi:flagellar basal body-associated protein FliL